MTDHILVIITGANRGFGQAIALAFVEQFSSLKGAKLSLVLVGRASTELEAVAQSISFPRVQTLVVDKVDLANLDQLDKNLNTVFTAAESAQANGPPFTRSILINNAGTLGNLSQTVGEYDWKEAKKHVDINIASFVAFCSEFLKRINASTNNQRAIVNISSLLAIQPTPYWGLYGMAKAARDSLLAVIALEEEKNNTKTLNYAPGPLDNSMQKQVRESIGDIQQKELYTNLHSNKKLVDMYDSAKKLVQLLFTNAFASGSHIDYYDLL